MNLFGAQVGLVVVRGGAADPQVVEQLAHLLGLSFGPVKVWTVKFHTLVAHSGDGAHCAFRIAL